MTALSIIAATLALAAERDDALAELDDARRERDAAVGAADRLHEALTDARAAALGYRSLVERAATLREDSGEMGAPGPWQQWDEDAAAILGHSTGESGEDR